MRVKIKPGCRYFIYNKIHTENDGEFDLKPVKHSLTGEIITTEMQFSVNNMIKVEEEKKKPGPKPRSYQKVE